jgi:hypothetical protein
MSKNVPTYEDAKLVLKLYELRRDEKLRQAREWFARKFFPRSAADVQAAMAPGNPDNVWLRMVFGYWEMAASFLVHGVLNPELFFESGAEMIFVWAKMEPFVGALRAEMNMPVLVNVEKAIALLPRSAERVQGVRTRISRLRDSLGSTPSSAV